MKRGARVYYWAMSDVEPTERPAVSDVLRSISDLATPLERSAVLEQVGRVAAESIGAELGFVGLVKGDDLLEISGVYGGRAGSLDALEVGRGRGLGGKVLALGEPASVVDYTAADSITHEYDKEIDQEGLQAMLCLPLVSNEGLLGVAYVSDRTPKVYSDAMIDRVVTSVESAKIAIAMADRSRQLTEAALEVDRQHTVEVLDASVRDHLAEILSTARSIASDPASSAELVAQASSIIATAGNASSLFDDSASELLRSPVVEHQPVTSFGLSPRELQVVRAAARGRSNPEIAEELFLARGTVKAYMETALRKLGARNRVEAVMIAAQAGLLEGV